VVCCGPPEGQEGAETKSWLCNHEKHNDSLIGDAHAVRRHRAGPHRARRATLEELQQILLPSQRPANGRINAQDKNWEDWVRRTANCRLTSTAMPSVAELPDPLMLDDGGRRITCHDARAVARKKRWIREQVERWVFGSMPPAPDNLRATVKGSRREGTVTVRDVLLEFGPGRRATLRVQLIIPEGRGAVPGVPHQPQPQPPLALHRRQPRLHRLLLLRHRPELRRRRRFRSFHRGLP